MNLHLFRRGYTCTQLGVCQRTGTECRRACHNAQPEQPVGYEAARTASIYQFPALQPQPQSDEARDIPDPGMDWLLLIGARISAVILIGILLLALIGASLSTPDSWLHNLLQWTKTAAWGALSVLS